MPDVFEKMGFRVLARRYTGKYPGLNRNFLPYDSLAEGVEALLADFSLSVSAVSLLPGFASELDLRFKKGRL